MQKSFVNYPFSIMNYSEIGKNGEHGIQEKQTAM